jgi:hypothetical protein
MVIATPGLPYAGNATPNGAGILSLQQTANGPQACLTSIQSKIFDREENTSTVGATFSPGVKGTASFCGEVATMTWGTSPLQASLTCTAASTAYTSGWAIFSPLYGTGANYGLPMTGFAAISANNGSQGYGLTWPLRW